MPSNGPEHFFEVEEEELLFRGRQQITTIDGFALVGAALVERFRMIQMFLNFRRRIGGKLFHLRVIAILA